MPVSARVASLPAPPAWWEEAPVSPVASALRAELAHPSADAELADFYRAHRYRPLWVRGSALRPESRELLGAIETASDDGLDPQDYRTRELAAALGAAQAGDVHSLARAELALSRTLVAYAADLRTPRPGAEMIYADPALRPPDTDPRAVLTAAAHAPSLGEHLAGLRRGNPVYAQLREALRAYRATTGRGEGDPDPREKLILANLERARALPPQLGQRFILVDLTAQTLWTYQDGRPHEAMRVGVGKITQPTPAMAGVIRSAVFRPYWNVPPDLVRNTVAREVLRNGPRYLESRGMEVLSDWTQEAHVVDPRVVDWAAVAAGRETPHIRQLPGPMNMMGAVKFMFPNEKGIYLHDTPTRWILQRTRRAVSSGCVRLEDAHRLAAWLGVGADLADASAEPERQVTLAEPVPIYLVYLTAAPGPAGVEWRHDIYGRDSALLAQLDRPARQGPVLARR